jgi:hypothetical protein
MKQGMPWSRALGQGVHSLAMVHGGGGGTFRSHPPPKPVQPGAAIDEEAVFRAVVVAGLGSSAEARAHWMPYLVNLAAGKVAQRMLDPSGKYDDRCKTDYARINGLVQAICDSDVQARAYVVEAERIADELIREQWPVISRLAAELRRHGTLNAEQIRAAIEGPKLGSGSPTPRRVTHVYDPNAFVRPISVVFDRNKLWVKDQPKISAHSLDELFEKLPAGTVPVILGNLPAHLRRRRRADVRRAPRPGEIFRREGVFV